MKNTARISGTGRNNMYDEAIRRRIDEIQFRRFKNEDEWKAGARWLLDRGIERKDDYLQGFALNQIAQATYAAGGRTEEVYHYIQQGIHYQRRVGDNLTLASSYNMLGIIESLHGFQPQAIDFFLPSLGYQENAGDRRLQEGIIYSNIAACYEALGDYSGGLAHPGRSSAQLSRASAHLIRSAV